MEEQEGQVQAARRRAAELEDQLEAERLPLLQADAATAGVALFNEGGGSVEATTADVWAVESIWVSAEDVLNTPRLDQEQNATPPPQMQCSVCGHIYDPEKDGGGKPFSELPSTWGCPVCGPS